jgi:hypothetical protein
MMTTTMKMRIVRNWFQGTAVGAIALWWLVVEDDFKSTCFWLMMLSIVGIGVILEKINQLDKK